MVLVFPYLARCDIESWANAVAVILPNASLIVVLTLSFPFPLHSETGV